MRKIYPLPFYKFAVLVLYGLLSIAVITLAQDPILNCGVSPLIAQKQQFVTIGYVQFFTNQVSEIEPKNIPWRFYDYINVIAYPKDPANPWNSIIRPLPGQEGLLKPIDDLVIARNDAKADTNVNTKILLSIRNYDPRQWNDVNPKTIITETIQTLTFNKLDGVDIEYPGMRGLHCNNDNGPPDIIWKLDDKRAEFITFIKDLRTEMKKLSGKKLLMLTAGVDTIDVVDSIDYLNIETYHDSLYENLKTPKSKSFSNSPLNKFQAAYNAWLGVDPNVSSKIIMGVDFGNTFQVVSNKDIEKTPSVDTDIIEFNLPQAKQLEIPPNPLSKLKQIKGLCPVEKDNELFLYSWAWKDLSASVIDGTNCKTLTSDWIYNFDDQSTTPWLQRKVPDDPEDYQFVSYEDFKSLSKKLNYATSKSIGGMSISDVSYDSVGSGSLLGFIQAIRSATPSQSPDNPSSPKSPNESSPKGKEGDTDPPNPNTSTNFEHNKIEKARIIGGVFGSLIGLAILGACGFYFYRYRGRPKSSSLRSLLKFNKGFPNSRNHAISRNPEMTSEPTLAPPTTVIPVASGYVTAMFDFTGKEENDLSFKKGDKIEVLERGDGPNDWWVGRVNGAVGEFPGNYVKET